ncbi:MAG: glycosyltransferase [Verrucomicrobia bacterium]|nr:glycosyltransferase [Verrucomicrobiota bacterium]
MAAVSHSPFDLTHHMNIALVNNPLRLGGAETVVEQLRVGILKAGHRATLHVASGRTHPPDAVPLYPRWLGRLSRTRLHGVVERLWPRAAWTDRAFRRLAAGDADVVHVHHFDGDYATVDSLADLARHKPVVWTFHTFWGVTGGCDHPMDCRRYQDACGQCPQLGRWPVGREDRTQEHLARKRLLLASAPLHIVAPSRHLAETIRGSRVGRHWRVQHIAHGVDPHRFRGTRKHDSAFRASLGLVPDATVILLVNPNFRDPRTGFARARAALAEIHAGGVDVVLAGQGSVGAAAQLPPGLRAVDAGHVASRQHMSAWFEAADILVAASATETFSCAVLEAMSAECCVVATPTRGRIEQIQHGTTGLLSAEISGPSLAQPLQEAVQSPRLRSACGAGARSRVERFFTEAAMIGDYLQCYESAAGLRAVQPPARLAA